jgi:ketosteroid isomerase-like protein
MTYNDPTDIAAVRRVFQQYQDYYTARDQANVDACMALFTSDPEVEVIGTGAITHGTDEWCDGPELVRQLTAGDWQGWGDVRFDVDGASIHTHGDVAWLATTATVSTTYPVDENLSQAVHRAKQVLDGPGDDENRLREMLMWATMALHEAGRGEVYIWPIRFTAVLVREAGEWRFHQAHFSFPTLRFPHERWTEQPGPATHRIDATAD